MMQRVLPLIWLLVIGLVGAQFASVKVAGDACCAGETSQSDNCCGTAYAPEHAADSTSHADSTCCSKPASPAPASDDKTHDHDPEPHPCKCPSQCCVVSKAPVSLTLLPSFDASTGHAPLVAPEWREPLPNPTLDRLKRPPRARATA
ncbi:MAG: hypothetical protein ACF8LK_06605 [Phycisphaerales bacterium JB041]